MRTATPCLSPFPRERMKSCCDQLRSLLPYAKGRKNDAASVFEATADYVEHVRERIPPAVLGQVSAPRPLASVLGDCAFTLRLFLFCIFFHWKRARVCVCTRETTHLNSSLFQITEALQSNRRFCKKQPLPVQLSLPDTIRAQRYDTHPCY